MENEAIIFADTRARASSFVGSLNILERYKEKMEKNRIGGYEIYEEACLIDGLKYNARER